MVRARFRWGGGVSHGYYAADSVLDLTVHFHRHCCNFCYRVWLPDALSLVDLLGWPLSFYPFPILCVGFPEDDVAGMENNTHHIPNICM